MANLFLPILFIVAAIIALFESIDAPNPTAAVVMAAVFGLIGVGGLLGDRTTDAEPNPGFVPETSRASSPNSASGHSEGDSRSVSTGSPYRAVEQLLVDWKVEDLEAMGMLRADARVRASELVDGAIERAQSTGRYDAGPLGEWVLAQSEGNLAEYIQEAFKEGVTESDILRWWDMDEVERQLVAIEDDVAHLAVYIEALEETGSGDGAAQIAWQTHPYYDYSAGATVQPNAKDQLLPVELKGRVNKWMESYFESFSENRPHPLLGYSAPEGHATMNAWLRESIQKDLL